MMLRHCCTPSLKIHMISKAVLNFTGSTAGFTLYGTLHGTHGSTCTGGYRFKLHATPSVSKGGGGPGAAHGLEQGGLGQQKDRHPGF